MAGTGSSRPRRPRIRAKLERAGLVEALPAEERRHPYRITAAGREFLYQRLTELARIAEVGLRRIAVAPS